MRYGFGFGFDKQGIGGGLGGDKHGAGTGGGFALTPALALALGALASSVPASTVSVGGSGAVTAAVRQGCGMLRSAVALL